MERLVTERDDKMQYTVKEISQLTGVTIKALHHYHKIGLLEPCKITGSGYRLYGEKELERLQQILFYRELDFPLKDIKTALDDEPNRLACLVRQQELLSARRRRMDSLLDTLKKSIESTEKGENMDKAVMFKGLNKEEWEDALKEQREYIKSEYGHDILENKEIEPEAMNEMAAEAQRFLKAVAGALVNGWKVTDERLQKILGEHIAFLNDHGIDSDARQFAQQTRFFLEDDFHRSMLEGQQTGLSYYLCIAAEAYAA